MLDHAFLKDASSYVSDMNSHAAQVARRSVSLSAEVLMLSGAGAVLTLEVEGSHEGRLWQWGDVDSLNLSFDIAPDPAPQSKASPTILTDCAYLRVRAYITSTAGAGQALVNASLNFTEVS